MGFIGKTSRRMRTRFFLLLLVALLPILVIQVLLYYDRYQARRAGEFRTNLELARAVGVAFNGLVEDVLHQELAIAIAATAPMPFSAERLEELLRRGAEDYHYVARFSWAGPDGKVLASSDAEFTGKDISDREYFREVLSGRDWVVSDLIHSKMTEEFIFTITRAIRNQNGELLGVSLASVHPDRLKEVLAIHRTKDAGVSLIDSKGMHVYRYPPAEYTWTQRDWLKAYPELEGALRGNEVATTVTSGLNGEKRLVGFAPVPSIGWVAAASRSEEDVMAAISSALVWHGSLFLVVTLIAFGIALALSHRICKSITNLRDHALALGQGEMENPAAVISGPSEIEELAHAYNEMARKVRSRERDLREKKEFLRAIIESTEDAIIVLDEQHRCMEVNPAAGAITGLPHKDLVGRGLSDFIDPGLDLPAAWSAFIQTGRFAGEVGIRHCDGTWHSVEAVGMANILPGRHLFVGHDITERKLAEEAMKKSEARLRRFYESGLIGVMYWNMDGMITDANDKFLEMVGYTQEDLIAGKIDWINMTPPEYRHLDEQAARELKYTGVNKKPYEKEYIRKDGSRVPIIIAGAMLDDARFNGVAFVLDITERKRSEEGLRESEERYRSMFNTLLEGFCVVEMIFDTGGKAIDYRFLEVNPAFEGQTGLRDAKGRLMRDLSPEHEDHWFEIFGRVAMTGEPVRFVNEAKAVNRWYDVYAYRVGGQESRKVAITFDDITERKLAEQVLRKSRDELELRVRERTAELERKNQELQEFAFVASHDLSEPLRKIQAFGTLLEERSADLFGERDRDLISRMIGSAGRMQELLNALLAYSRVDTKGQKFRAANLDHIVREAVSDLEVTIGKIGACVEVGQLPSVTGDPTQLRQMFQNLISNSLKYRRSEVKPFIRVHGEESGGACRIFVEDYGIGFDEKYLDKIFQPFQRLHGRNEYPGIGMGLAICRKIVERHHGTITAKSTPGRGSTFIITLPLKDHAEPTGSKTVAAGQGS